MTSSCQTCSPISLYGSVRSTSTSTLAFMEQARWRMRTAKELLQHISRTPSFAALVKCLSIESPSPALPGKLSRIFIPDQTAGPVQALTNLHTFAWLGYSDELRSDIAQALFNSCFNLRRLRIPYSNSFFPLLPKFRMLETLELARERAIPSVYDPNVNSQAQHIVTAILSNSSTLRPVSMFGDGAWGCSDLTFTNLTNLELLAMRDCDKLCALLSCCPQL
ncbi:hypothetical protein LXA43DRAFT_16113 [Ganoderma leucocontextum]|nr:hypothetical protein LXA43DRAFT_16113 [Ganoderma leucocontextum]